MNNYSNFSRNLKQELLNFLKEIAFSKCKRFESKLILDLVWGTLKSGSILISEIARALNENKLLIHTEVRLTNALCKYDLTKLIPCIQEYSLKNLSILPRQINIDESDIIKPFGYAFEDLCEIHDGSKNGRPKEKGYNVLGIVCIGISKTVLPLFLNIYSTKSKNYISKNTSTENELFKINNIIDKDNSIYVFDRGYDASFYVNLISGYNKYFVIRAKEQRKYITNYGIESINEISNRLKGKYTTKFKNKDGDNIQVKISAVKVSHQDFKNDAWIVIEIFSNTDKRLYLTNIDCSTKEGCVLALKSYRGRWRIEELFRFIKQEFGFEKYRVRSLKAMNNLCVILLLISTFITKIYIERNKLYFDCLDSYKSFKDKIDEETLKIKYGEYGLMLYRIKRGLQEILKHIAVMPKVPGRDRTKKAKYTQLTIYDFID